MASWNEEEENRAFALAFWTCDSWRRDCVEKVVC
jgi:hypothetical protein